MKILRVEPGSPAGRAGLCAGDEILEVNGHPMRDALDYLFASAEEGLRMRVRRAGGGEARVRVARRPGETPGIEIAPDPVRRCANRCIFCFVDQNPPGLRPRLYVKDEDYRLSLLYGNYLTLTRLREWEIDRILTRRLSPLYVSVHATDAAVRRHLLGCHGDGAILPLLRRLAAGGIRLHTQIVLVPGLNDGDVLEGTLDDLESLHPAVRSVAVVPVGLTRHRRALAPLRPVTPARARRVVAAVEARQARNRAARGTRLHFLADEFYFLAGLPLPGLAAYEDLPQIENGVGMVRRFEREIARRRRLLPRAPGRRGRAAVVTGTRFAPVLAARIAARLQATGESGTWRVDILPVRNRLFGASVNVAGLLGGHEVLAALRRSQAWDVAILPPEMLNADLLTLDGLRPADLARALGRPVRIGLGPGAAEARAA